MNKSTLGIIVGLVAILAIVGVVLANRPDKKPASNTNKTTQTSPSDTATETPPAANETTEDSDVSSSDDVVIENFAFSPSQVTVKKGTTVTWTNNDSDRHDITPDDETDEFKKSELLSKGETYQVTFNTPGTYTYHCTPHPQMTGKVVVTE